MKRKSAGSPTDSGRALADVIGYGAELADALDRYARAGTSAGEDRKQDIQSAWAKWIGRAPHAANLCYADITFFSADHPMLRDALTVVFTPEGREDPQANHGAYMRALQRYLSDDNTMAPHDVFAAGLPFILGPGAQRTAPQTTDELAAFLNARPSGAHVESGFLMRDISVPESSEAAGSASSGEPTFYVGPMSTYGGKGKFTQAFAKKVSQSPIALQFDKWCAVFEEEAMAGRLRSHAGGRPNWIIAMPIGTRDDARPDQYTLVSCMFLGFDSSVNEGQVFEAIRYLLLHLYEANATSSAVRRGESQGRHLRGLAASHELQYVINAIQPALGAFAARLLRDYFEQLLLPSHASRARAARAEFAGRATAHDVDLAKLIRDGIETAAGIEKLAQLAAQGIQPGSETQVEAAVRDFAAQASAWTTVIATCKRQLRLTAESLDAFRNATTAALRNALKHSQKRTTPAIVVGVIDVDVRELAPDGTPVVACESSLVVRNEFLWDDPTTVGADVSQGGTLGALRLYAIAYGSDPRRVSIRRTDLSEDTGRPRLERFRETWETRVPLPESIVDV